MVAIACLLLVNQARASDGWVFCKVGTFSSGVNTINFSKLADCGFDDFDKIQLKIITPVYVKVRVSFDGGVYREAQSHAAGVYLNYAFSGASTSISLNSVGSAGDYEIEAFRPGLADMAAGLNLPVASLASSSEFSASVSGFISGGLILVLLIYFNGIEIFLTTFYALLKVLNVR